MIRYLLLAFSLSMTFSVSSQSLNMDWRQCFGGSGFDEGNDLVMTNSGYLILAVWDQEEIWLIKTDFDGNFEWDKKYGGSDVDYAKNILKKNDNTYYIIGSTRSSDGDISFDPYPDSDDFWIIKIDSLGNILWDKIFGGTGRDDVFSACLNSEDGITILGETTSCDGDIENCYGSYDICIMKIDSNGNRVWTTSIGGTFLDEPHGILQTSEGGYLVTGNIYPELSPNGNLTCENGNDSWDGFLVKLDSTGGIEWQRCYGGSQIDILFSAIELADGYMIGAIGSSNDGDLKNSGYHLGYYGTNEQTPDTWIIKTDFSGNIIWQKCYGGSEFELLNRIFQTETGYRVFNYSFSFDGDVTGNHSNAGFSDIWTFEIDSLGNLMSNQCFGDLGNEQMSDGVVKLADYKYVLTSFTESFEWGCSGVFDVLLYQITDTLLDASDELELSTIIETFPVPANDHINFNLKVPGKAQFEIYNSLGIKQDAFVTENDSYTLSTKNKPAGLYIYKLMLNGRIHCGKFMIIR